MKSSDSSDFLFDTSVLSVMLDTQHASHEKVLANIRAMPSSSRKIVSVVALGEILLGRNLAQHRIAAEAVKKIDKIVREVQSHEPLIIGRSTSQTYGRLKSKVATYHMPKAIQKRQKALLGNPEVWKNEITGRLLQIQENDLWQCAQAVERDLVFVTADLHIERISEACDGELKILCL